MSPKAKAKALASLFVFALTGTACGDASVRIALAGQLLEEGNFDQAFEAYERLYQNGERAPQVLAGLGLLLSAQPVAAFAGIDLMEQSLAAASNEEVREQLMLLYLAMGRLESARGLIHPDRLSVEQVYSPGITRLRLGLNCLRSPGRRSLQQLNEAPAHPRREFFVILCSLLQRGDTAQPEAAIQQWREFRQREAQAACEALSVWPSADQLPALRRSTTVNAKRSRGMAAFLRVERARCRDDFPGEISIQRDTAGLRSLATGLDRRAQNPGSQADRELFAIDVYDPGDPGPEVQKRTYVPLPPAASDGPFVPLGEIP